MLENTQVDYFELNSGYKIPKIGFGTKLTEQFENALKNALSVGYRLIDTASIYNTEEIIGNTIKDMIDSKKIKREDLFITSKLFGEEKLDVLAAVKRSLHKLQMTYLDLYLVHWPGGYFNQQGEFINISLSVIWREMEKCVELGLVRSIGVSNINVQLLIDLLSYAKIKPAVNQIEVHPYLQQPELVECCQKFNILVQSSSPLGKAGKKVRQGNKYDILTEPLIEQLSKKYQKSPSQILLNWLIQRKIAAVPRSENEIRQQQNLSSNQFQISEQDLESIKQLEKNIRFNESHPALKFDYFK